MLLETFGNRLRLTREKNGISQLELSNSTGVMRDQISRIENGQINPTLETIYKLSEALNVSLSNLFNFEILEKNSLINYQTKPFVKWAGGKTQLLDKIKELMPKKYGTYYEPFIGGGAVFFNINPKSAVISDFNSELINAYQTFQDEKLFKEMIKELTNHEKNHNEEYFYMVREMDRKDNFSLLSKPIKAARLIYLNKACFNGLYRVNSKGYFNVPSGKKEVVKAYQPELFKNIYNYLNKNEIKILNEDFEKTVETAKHGDFVYFDPPYDSFDEQNNFTTYTKDDFGKDEQKRLSEVFKSLDKKGVFVMLSNHNTNYIRELYDGYNIEVVRARRNINSKATGRGSVEEVIITNY